MVLAEPILVGREKELEELQRCLDSAKKGKGKTVFISGEAGSGKTRLINEFLSKTDKTQITVLSGWCLSDTTVPYLPFAEAFRKHFAADEETIEISLSGTLQPPAKLQPAGIEEYGIAAWVSGLSGPIKRGKIAVASPQVWKDQLFTAVAETLHSMSKKQPVLLLIEDVHWADSASLALLHYIARVINETERILVIATFRSGELTSDAEGRPHPLSEALRIMRREELVTEISLSSLDQDCVAKMAESMMGASLQKEFAGKLVAESRGNPLFVVESLRMLHERKSLVQENSEWRLSVDELGIPHKIRDIILRRLAALKHAERRILDAASVIGEEFNVELLSIVLGQDSLDVIESLSMIEQSTSIVRVEGASYRFDHARSREVLYEALSLPLKRGYHAKVAEKLEDMSKAGNLNFSEIARHYAQAGNKEKAIKYALVAGQDALARWSNTEAIKQFTYVAEALGEDPESAEKRLSAQEGLGDAYFASDNFSQAVSVFDRLASLQSGAAKLRALRKAIIAVFQLGDASHLMELVKKAEPYAAADRLESARILHYRGLFFHLRSMFFDTTGNMEAALQVFKEEYSLPDVAFALNSLGGYHAWFGMLEEGLAESLLSIAMFEEIGDLHSQMEAYWSGGCSFMNSTLYREALKMWAKIIEFEEKMKIGGYSQQVNACIWSAHVLNSMGNHKEALAFDLKALEFSRKTDATLTQATVCSELAIEYTMLGDLKHAEEYFEKLMQFPKEIINHQLVGGQLAMAVFFAGKNRWEESNRAFEEMFEMFKDVRNPFQRSALKARHYAWALERQGRFDEAQIQRKEMLRTHREAEERFAHASVQANLMVRRQVVVGEEFEMRLDIVNVSRKPALLVEVKNLVPDDFEVPSLPSWCSIEDGSIEMNNKELGSFQVNTTKLTLKCLEAGTFTLNPQAVYVDDLGKTKTFDLPPITVTVNPPAPEERVAGRISSGTPDLDRLFLGGIPENYAVVLTSSTDEKERVIQGFLEAGAKGGEAVFHVATDALNTRTLLEEYPSNFLLILCNLQADTIIQNASNVFKLKGVENLTDVDIALTKAFRVLETSAKGPRRICIDILSDVLLQHHAVKTRRWLSALLPTLKSRGFTVLAAVNPRMHSPEEFEAVLGLFDGEMGIYDKETPKGALRFLKIRKMTGQKYLKDEIPLTGE